MAMEVRNWITNCVIFDRTIKYLMTQSGIIDRFLSWRGFLPLSRLTYCVYLIHYDYLNVFYSLNRKILYYTFIEQFTTFLGIVVAVFGLAFLVSVCVEAPFINLERLVLISSKSTDSPRLFKKKSNWVIQYFIKDQREKKVILETT